MKYFYSFSLALLVCTTFSKPPLSMAADPGTHKIGVNLGLSGFLGQPNALVKNGMILAMEQINTHGGINGKPIELDFKDNASDISKSTNAMMVLARDKKYLAVIGPLWNAMEPAMKSVAEKEKVPLISICPTDPSVRKMGFKWSFNIAQNEKILSNRVIELLAKKNFRKVLVFFDEQPLFIESAQLVKKMADDIHIKVIISDEQLRAGTLDFAPIITKSIPLINKQSIDSIYLCTQPQIGVLFMKNMRVLGLDVPVVATHPWGAPFVLGMGGESVDKVMFPTGKIVIPSEIQDSDPQQKTLSAYSQAYQARFHMPADQLSGNGYDAVMIIARALERCGGKPDRSQLRNQIEATRGYVGVTGIFHYSESDHEGLKEDSMVFVQINGNTFRRMDFSH